MEQILVDLWESRNPTIRIFNGTKKDIILKIVDDNYHNIFFCINKKIIYILDKNFNLYVNYQYYPLEKFDDDLFKKFFYDEYDIKIKQITVSNKDLYFYQEAVEVFGIEIKKENILKHFKIYE